ncbi:DUF3927 domain-containing protein [Hafnia alvei]|nr:DUF3927 domain-containing protein [Hafnia alvei]TBL46644.1 DUF3927 domain-containing protein [Hafnia alvei]TBL49077.1 DUF3927 domain-containing protein [Obesumbacterium proteus]TBL75579.1 DUF3927 domain-containing protein [Obesumbacterium proteus]TBM19343.1 DUF3927 domain-containing protein [Hafnia alvei]
MELCYCAWHCSFNIELLNDGV